LMQVKIFWSGRFLAIISAKKSSSIKHQPGF
jgi:hypothetical protein